MGLKVGIHELVDLTREWIFWIPAFDRVTKYFSTTCQARSRKPVAVSPADLPDADCFTYGTFSPIAWWGRQYLSGVASGHS